MAFTYKDRVKCTTTTTGTGSYTFGSAVTGYQSFSTISDSSTIFYVVDEGATSTNWEINIGVKTGTTITRGTLLASSTGSAINWAAGTRYIYLTPPAYYFTNNWQFSSPNLIYSGGAIAVNTVTPEATLFDFRDTNRQSATFGYTAFGWIAGQSSSSVDLEITNSSTAAGATADLTLWNDNQSNYGGIGQVSTNYNVSGYSAYSAYDLYVYSFANNLILNAVGSGKAVKILAGGGNTANIISTFNASGLHSTIANQTGYTTTATAAGTTTLTSASTQQQFFTGTSTQTVKLPDTSTLSVGDTYRIRNLSTGTVTVQTSTAAALTALATGIDLIATCISTAGNTAAAWDLEWVGSQMGQFIVTSTTASTPAASTAWGSIGGLSAAPAAQTGSGGVVTVTNSTSKIECTVNTTGYFMIWVEGNCDGASTSPYFGFRFTYNGTQTSDQTDILNNSGYYPTITCSAFGSITGGQLVEFQFQQQNGTGQRTTTMKHLKFNWRWTPK